MTCYSKRAIQLREPLEYSNGLPMTHINVDCNKCIECIERKKTEWCFRMEQEQRDSKIAYFVTLTYNPENVPYNKYYKKTLKPKHITDYFKRLRHYHSKLNKPIKRETKLSKKAWKEGMRYTPETLYNGLTYKDKISYVACGEYGDLRKRPHYHAIIFNASRKHINEAWKKGEVQCKKVDGKGAAAYVMKYMDKKIGTYQDKTKEKEFVVTSEGIGEGYIKRMKDWHLKHIEICYVPSNIGALIPMPKYYRDKIFNRDQRMKQVQYIQDKLETEKTESIEKNGIEKHTQITLDKKIINRIKFKKQLKTRNYD